jgi:hypothetical protein
MFKYFLPVILLICSFTTTAQHPARNDNNSSNDIYSKLEKTRIEYLNELYAVKIEPSFELINGREYFPYYFRSKQKPILLSEKKHTSSITLNGRKYDNISIDYDTFLDEVIYIDSTRINVYSPLRVILNKNNIDCFALYSVKDTMTFRYFSKNTDPAFDLEDGFYEVVLDSDPGYLIRHKSILLKVDGTGNYNNAEVGYLNIGHFYYKITTTKQFIRLFGDRQEEIKTIINHLKINIRKADKTQIAKVLKSYLYGMTPGN